MTQKIHITSKLRIQLSRAAMVAATALKNRIGNV